jgi:predicted anti-sigma-YlaC factor YlaD
MNETCDLIRDLLPWYVNGTLRPKEARQVATHLLECGACREELAEWMRIQLEVRHATRSHDKVRREAKETVLQRTTGTSLGHLDVGSFLLGVSLGASYRRGRLPLRGDLHLFGRKIRLISPAKEESDER